jgi:hypothetical protein
MKPHKLSRRRILEVLCSVLAMAVPLLAQEVAPVPVSLPYAGATISDFKGKIELKALSQASVAPVRGLTLTAGTEVSTGNGRLLLHLNDGSEVLLGPNTRLILTQPTPGDWKYLRMIIGKIRVEVQRRLDGAPGFEIGTPSAVISVRGTRFLVEVNRRGVTEVDVEQGWVELRALNDLGKPILLGPSFSSRVGEDSAPEPARPTRELRPELERPGRETTTNHKLELDDFESRSGRQDQRSELSGFDEDETRPSASPPTRPSETEPSETGSPEPNL